MKLLVDSDCEKYKESASVSDNLDKFRKILFINEFEAFIHLLVASALHWYL